MPDVAGSFNTLKTMFKNILTMLNSIVTLFHTILNAVGTVYVPDVILYRLRAGCYNVPLTCRMLLGCSSFVPFTCQMSSSTGSAPDVILLYRLRAGRYDVTLLVHPAGLSKNEGAAGTPPRGRLQSGRPLLVSGEA